MVVSCEDESLPGVTTGIAVGAFKVGTATEATTGANVTGLIVGVFVTIGRTGALVGFAEGKPGSEASGLGVTGSEAIGESVNSTPGANVATLVGLEVGDEEISILEMVPPPHTQHASLAVKPSVLAF